ncbi:hypothetical protein KY285_000831 [Solanum tuberosum]|nr:hypothetical protein KY285_000831 [Solanum tuberosum]
MVAVMMVATLLVVFAKLGARLGENKGKWGLLVGSPEKRRGFWVVLGLVSLVVCGGRVVVCDLVGGRWREGLFELLGLRENSGVV